MQRDQVSDLHSLQHVHSLTHATTYCMRSDATRRCIHSERKVLEKIIFKRKMHVVNGLSMTQTSRRFHRLIISHVIFMTQAATSGQRLIISTRFVRSVL